jgi:chemotaxis protein CheC
MPETQKLFDDAFMKALREITQEGVNNAARGFSGMVGQTLTVSQASIEFVPVMQIPGRVNELESEAVVIYLRAEGALSGHMVLILPLKVAYDLVDLLMDQPPDTTHELGSLERSALGEIGNISSAYFLNLVYEPTGQSSRPTTPAVIVDMVGAILDVIVAALCLECEEVILLQTIFSCCNRQIDVTFWVIPDSNSLINYLQKT